MERFLFIAISLIIVANSYSQLLISHGPLGGGQSQLLDSLFAYYPLDDASGSFIDVHGSRDLTASGTLTYSVGGKVGTCVTFITDGHGKYTADDFEFPGSYSISCWVKTGHVSAWQGIVTYYGDGGSGDRGWHLRKNAGGAGAATGVAMRYYSGGNVLSVSTSAVNDDGWHHVVYTFDSSDDNVRVYVDGDLEDTDNDANGIDYDTDCDLEIGSSDDGQFWDGEIDEVAIYRGRALTEGAIDSIWNLGNGLAYPLDF